MPRQAMNDLQEIMLTTTFRTWQDAEAWCADWEPWRRGPSGEQASPWRLTTCKGGICVRGTVWLSCDALRHGMLHGQEHA